MANDSAVLKEFLVSLGFAVQAPSFRKFFQTLTTSEKMATKTGVAVVGVAVAAEEMVRIFARGMERLFYSSQRTKSSVESLQALRFAAQQVGVDADEASGALEGMSKILRTQPGSRALLEQILGEPSANKENIELFYSLIRKLGAMPHEIGTQFAERFGIDEKTFFMLKANIDQLEAAERKRRQMNRDAGIDAQKAAEASKEYMNVLRELWENVGILASKMAIDMLPAFKEFSGHLIEVLKFVQKLDYSGLDALLESVDQQGQKWGRWGSEIKLVTDTLRGFANLFSPTATGKFFAFMFGGPNYQNGGRLDGGLFPKGTPGYDAARRTMSGEDGVGSNELGKQMVALGLLRKHLDSGAEFGGAELGALEAEIAATQRRIASMKAQGFVPSGINAPGALSAMKYGESGGAPITINQTNEFNVSTSDPGSAARQTAANQDKAASEIVRNLRGAHR